MQVVILAGGMGSRLSEETDVIPKPMVRIGSKPIVEHIINVYQRFGFSEFLIAAGYKYEILQEYFNSCELTPGLSISVVDTGLTTETAGRLLVLSEMIKGTFMLTYGDGLCDLDLDALLKLHRQKSTLATLTAVHPPARFGSLKIDETRITKFNEKDPTDEGWINGGFMVLEKDVIKLISNNSEILERAVLPKLATMGQLTAYKHTGWWFAMDTLRDKRTLVELWNSGCAPWVI
jgi:glucose-1-phosphate cytidylyltransferase